MQKSLAYAFSMAKGRTTRTKTCPTQDGPICLDFSGFCCLGLHRVYADFALITQRSVNENTSPPKKFCLWTWDTCVGNFQLVPQKKYRRKTQTKSVKKVRCQDLSRHRRYPRWPPPLGRTLPLADTTSSSACRSDRTPREVSDAPSCPQPGS